MYDLIISRKFVKGFVLEEIWLTGTGFMNFFFFFFFY